MSYQLEITSEHLENEIMHLMGVARENHTIDTLKSIFSFIDLTSLNSNDNESKITEFCKKVNRFHIFYPQIPNVAAICVFPNMVNTVKGTLKIDDVNIAAVTAGFPASQTFMEIKIRETQLSIEAGANEIDIVHSIGKFQENKLDEVKSEISAIKNVMGRHHLKVILETGLLASPADIYKASMLAMEAGADFIKTSTGKLTPAATPEAVYVMCLAIKEFHKTTGKKIGLKPAGGISFADQAVLYYTIVKSILGNEWLTPALFRIGASSLANNLIKEINTLDGKPEGEKYF